MTVSFQCNGTWPHIKDGFSFSLIQLSGQKITSSLFKEFKHDEVPVHPHYLEKSPQKYIYAYEI